MTTTPQPDHEDERATEIPRSCRPLFNALVDAVLLGAPLSPAIDLAMAGPAGAMLLRDHLQAGLGEDIEDDVTILGRRLRPRVLNVLRPMVARIEARRLMNEIEDTEGEKIIPGAEEAIPARVESNDAEKLPLEPANTDAHKP